MPVNHLASWFRRAHPVLIIIVAGFCLVASLCSLAGAIEKVASECDAPLAFSATVTRVIDAETVELDSGQVVRLIGSLAPRAPINVTAQEAWPPEMAAETALKHLVLGHDVAIHAHAGGKDRFGRLLAQIYVKDAGEPIWVQGRLVSEGHGRAYGLPGFSSCLEPLIARERVARLEERGLWKLSVYRPRDARKTFELLRLRSTFQIVEGTVDSVANVRGVIYLNFGPDWRTDFTAFLPSAVVSSAFGSADALMALRGRKIRVRGWIRQRNGPQIEVAHRAEIETLNGDSN
jgi:endonuclease YncB( thermonuclease family)